MLILAKLVFFLSGWQIVGGKPAEKKFIIIVAPHTSNMDFILGRLTASLLRIKIFFLMKKEAFFFPIGAILRMLHAIPIDRKRPSEMLNKIVRKFIERKSFVLVITPEGTRKRVHNWKKGFYYMATKANVPVVPCGVNYRDKRLIIGDPVYPTNNEKSDLQKIMEFYNRVDLVAKHPENYQPPKI